MTEIGISGYQVAGYQENRVSGIGEWLIGELVNG